MIGISVETLDDTVLLPSNKSNNEVRILVSSTALKDSMQSLVSSKRYVHVDVSKYLHLHETPIRGFAVAVRSLVPGGSYPGDVGLVSACTNQRTSWEDCYATKYLKDGYAPVGTYCTEKELLSDECEKKVMEW
jgi:hypothetical protein